MAFKLEWERGAGKETREGVMTLEERVENLERELAHMKRDRVEPEVRARSFVLVDDNGKDRAALAMTEDGPRLFLSDENGEPRVTLSVQKDGARLSLWDENGKNRVGLSVLKNGPGVSVTKDMPNLTLMDGKGKVVWKAP